MNITTGKLQPRGLRAVIYGVEGIGKTTLASKLDKPLFLDLEKGSFGLDTARIDGTRETWQGVLGLIENLKRDHQGYRTFVVDSADKLEEIIVRDYLGEKNVQTLVGYLADSGMDVVLIGHAQQRRVELPEQTDSYDHWELNLSKRAAPKTREWPEILAFINYKMSVIASQRDFGKVVNKADGGKRMVYTSHTPFWDAKHRAGVEMPDEFPLDEAPKIFRAVLSKTADRSEQPMSTSVNRPEPKPQPKPQPKPATTSAAKTVAKPAAAPKAAKSPLREALDNYGITDDEIRNYIREKNVCGNHEPWQVDDIPAKFAEWLMARMDAIAKKIKG